MLFILVFLAIVALVDVQLNLIAYSRWVFLNPRSYYNLNIQKHLTSLITIYYRGTLFYLNYYCWYPGHLFSMATAIFN